LNWSFPKPVIAPANILLAVLLFIAVTQIISAYLLTQQQWTGIRVTATPADTLLIKSISANSPASGKLAAGETLLGLQVDGKLLQIKPLLNGYAPLSPATFAQRADFYQQQQTLHQAFTQNAQVTFVTTTGKTVSLTPAARTPVTDIPAVFWLLCLANMISPLVGALVWTYRPYQKASLFLLLHSLLYYVFAVSGAGVIATEFYMEPGALRQNLLLQATGINFAATLILVILCDLPKPLVRGLWLFWLVMGFTALSTANYHYGWFETPGHIFYIQYPFLYVIVLGIIALQMHHTRRQPVERASLHVLAAAFMLPNAIIIALHVFPILLGKPPIVGNISALLLFNLMAIGLGVGILRYRLFAIEFWWLKSMLWIVGGLLVAGIDVALMTLLQLRGDYVLAMSVIIAGFLYFPLRQWLLDKIIPMERQNLSDFLPALSSNLGNALSKETFEQRWQESLQQRFLPLHIEKLSSTVTTTNLSDNGLHLDVPSLGKQHAWRLTGKQRAARLFNKTDVKHTESLLTVARMASNASETRQQAILEERRRIMHDLHDSVGAKLLTLSHKLPDATHREDVRQALITLRETVRLSQQASPTKLVDNIADWRAEIAGRAEAAAVRLRWRQDERLNACQLCPRRILQVSQILREAVSNALRHAEPETLEVGFALSNNKLHLIVTNDGKISPPERWQAGTGVNGIRHRVAALGGEVGFYGSDPPQSRITVHIVVPLQA
jgi:Signal transduction histidine kinase